MLVQKSEGNSMATEKILQSSLLETAEKTVNILLVSHTLKPVNIGL